MLLFIVIKIMAPYINLRMKCINIYLFFLLTKINIRKNKQKKKLSTVISGIYLQDIIRLSITKSYMNETITRFKFHVLCIISVLGFS